MGKERGDFEMTVDQAVRVLRADPRHRQRIYDSYLDGDNVAAARRFLSSAEFVEVMTWIGHLVVGGRILDLGAGTGMASRAFAESGAEIVHALEPDPSPVVGRAAIDELARGTSIRILDGVGEDIPLETGSVDVVYTRQSLHHTSDLAKVMREVRRVLSDGGVLLATREHVADDERQLQRFLKSHPIHSLAGGENAFPLQHYLDAIDSSGLQLHHVLGPWDSIINAFPTARDNAELADLPRVLLGRKLGRVGRVVGFVPGSTTLVWAVLKRPAPGRMYSFAATKDRELSLGSVGAGRTASGR